MSYIKAIKIINSGTIKLPQFGKNFYSKTSPLNSTTAISVVNP